uniref:Uncharacterized protein n=1 Tax=Arundo donax TaxID=35708 RepID=A0A0A9HIR3_ARUDO
MILNLVLRELLSIRAFQPYMLLISKQEDYSQSIIERDHFKPFNS